MKLSRRNFQKLLGMQLVAFPLLNCQRSQASTSAVGLSILQGSTDSHSTVLSIMAPKNASLEVKAIENLSRRVLLPTSIELMEKVFSEWRIYCVQFENLQSQESYELQVTDTQGLLLDTRTFKTLDIASSHSRFAVGSCMNDFKHRDEIWQALQVEQPDFFLLIGDSVYADKNLIGDTQIADEEQLWNRYVQSRLNISFYGFKQLIPTFAVWDDHDIGMNNCNRNFSLIDEAQLVFRKFFPCQNNKMTQLGPGNSKLVQTIDQDIFLLDGRTFRTEVGAVDESLFGADQENWIFSSLNPNRVVWLMAGTQWFTSYPGIETYVQSHPNSFQQFMGRLKASQCKVIFVSGDVHFSEITKVPDQWLGYETLEITSSSLHSSFVPGMDRFLANPNRVISKAARNFFIIESGGAASHFKGRASCIAQDQKSIFDIDLGLF